MLKNTLNIKLQNKLTLTLGLKQQLSLLLLPKLELKEMVQQELEENPFLEELLKEDDFKEPIKDLTSYTPDEEVDPFYKLTYEPSIYDNLETQIDLEFNGVDNEIAKEIIKNIDDRGFFTGNLKEIAKVFGKTEEYIENIRKKLIVALEPTGIASISLEEFIWEQYRETFGEDLTVKEIIFNDLEKITNRNHIIKKYKISNDDYENILDNLRLLNPYPTYQYGSEVTKYIEPDVFVYDKGDYFEVEVNDRGIPKLRLTNNYRKLLSDKSISEETKKYLEEKLQKAMGIIKGIELRRENLKRVAEYLVNYQADYLRKGKEFKKPLTLKDVATELGFHESTISRIISNKYMQTDFGLLPFKSFFSTKLSSENGDVSVERVKHLIREIIDNEDKKKPLSDEKISRILKEKYKINIARRTVAKYREEMNIPSSKDRKIR